MKTPAVLVNGIVNNALLQFSQHINQTLQQHQLIHILHFCLVDSLLNCIPDFVVRVVRPPHIWKFIRMTKIS